MANTYMSTFTENPTNTRDAKKIADFALRMTQIPRKAQTCSVYGTVRPVVDQRHAMNIFRKVFQGAATKPACYDALNILQDRLDGDY